MKLNATFAVSEAQLKRRTVLVKYGIWFKRRI